MDEIIRNQQFKIKFSRSIGIYWKTLGRWLSIEDSCLDAIERDYAGTENQAYEMLKKWTNMSDNASIDLLTAALINMERIDLIKELETFKDSNQSSSKWKKEVSGALKTFYLKSYGETNKTYKFIELCIVDAAEVKKDASCFVEREQFLKKQMNYTPISFDKVFSEESSLFLISGIAGIGKTCLLRKCLLDWSNGLIWKNVELLFYFECRRLNQYQNISKINELVGIFYKDILKNFNINSCNIMFVIDGLDEFQYLDELLNNNPQCEIPIIKTFLNMQKYKLLIAGRINAISQYENILSECNDKLTVQIMGFNENGINNYIEKNVVEQTNKTLKKIFNESPIAKAMASVPFYLSSMCTIIAESNLRESHCFKTMTDLYASIFFNFLKKHINKNNEPVYKMMENESIKQYVFNICKIAYHLFIESKITFSKKEIQNIFNNVIKVEELHGFIEKIETDLGCYYQFVHLTIMEFCASVYAYNYLSGKMISTNIKLRSCLPMICGLLNKDENSYVKFLANLKPENHNIFLKFFLSLTNKSSEKLSLIDVPDIPDDYCFQKLLYECFYESQSSIVDEIKSFIDERRWMISIDNGKTSYETSCDSYFVNQLINSGRMLTRLDVRKNILSDDEKYLIIKGSTNVRYVWLYHSIKFNGWKPKDKIEWLTIYISKFLISKNDFEECFLPWIYLCKKLSLYLNKVIDFIEDIYKWICFSNIEELFIKYRGKDFRSLEDIKKFLNSREK
ncbi:NACHT, LRR and PYD domains-containing protein 3 isoform X1 [Hydra vulgaris]|uniref:NACHT, LRR and PYD domains-containing protein 3 isoform X1 n=1 Tax=Hydra vulgaris TaxID=6087 RepID=UPI001F5E6E3E|nr:NACHT, LRR and PYD domains-containing protein 3-like isoform X1 [Hydra vulgaris]